MRGVASTYRGTWRETPGSCGTESCTLLAACGCPTPWPSGLHCQLPRGNCKEQQQRCCAPWTKFVSRSHGTKTVYTRNMSWVVTTTRANKNKTLTITGTCRKQCQTVSLTYPLGAKSILRTFFKWPSSPMMHWPVLRSHNRPRASRPLPTQTEPGKECSVCTPELNLAHCGGKIPPCGIFHTDKGRGHTRAKEAS